MLHTRKWGGEAAREAAGERGRGYSRVWCCVHQCIRAGGAALACAHCEQHKLRGVGGGEAAWRRGGGADAGPAAVMRRAGARVPAGSGGCRACVEEGARGFSESERVPGRAAVICLDDSHRRHRRHRRHREMGRTRRGSPAAPASIKAASKQALKVPGIVCGVWACRLGFAVCGKAACGDIRP